MNLYYVLRITLEAADKVTTEKHGKFPNVFVTEPVKRQPSERNVKLC